MLKVITYLSIYLSIYLNLFISIYISVDLSMITYILFWFYLFVLCLRFFVKSFKYKLKHKIFLFSFSILFPFHSKHNSKIKICVTMHNYNECFGMTQSGVNWQFRRQSAFSSYFSPFSHFTEISPPPFSFQLRLSISRSITLQYQSIENISRQALFLLNCFKFILTHLDV